MPERFADKIFRKWQELQECILKRIFKAAIERYDKLNNNSFMAFSWGIDDVTDYHVIAERSYPDHHIYGSVVTWYDHPLPKENKE